MQTLCIALMALVGALAPNMGETQTLTLEWDPNAETNIASYRIYAGTSSHNYTLPMDSVPGEQTTFVFATGTPGVRYYFAVTAVNIFGLESPFSSEVNGSVPAPRFTDHPLLPGVHVMRAVHISELRTGINGLRSRFGLPTMSWTDSAPGSTIPIRAVHVNEMRSALAEVYQRLGLTPPTYMDQPLAAGTPIKAVHITQLRAAVLAVE